MAPFNGEGWGGFVQEHVVCRSVRDSALFLDISDAPTPGEPYAAPHKARPWVQEVGENPGKLRIGWTTRALYGAETHPDCVAAVEDAVGLLQELGHEVEESCPPFDREEMIRAYFLTVAAGISRFVENTSAAAGKRPRASDYEPSTWVLAQVGWKTSAPELLASQNTMQRNARGVAAWIETPDIFLSPNMARPPARIGELTVQKAERAQLGLVRGLGFKAVLDVALDKMAGGRLAWTPNTQLFNQTGQPGMSMPLFWSQAGLPIGTQFVGRFGEEATLFRLAAQLEEARPWAGRVPPLT
jgi:amidase